jgi:hypothetical protein
MGAKLKKICVVIVFAVLPFICFANEAEYDLNRYEKIIETMVADLDRIIKEGMHSKNINDVFTLANNCISTGRIRFAIDPEKNTILGGMAFCHNTKTDEIHFSFGRSFLDTYRQGETIQLVIMMHEMRHLYDFITSNKQYIEAKNNKNEEYWFELDAIHIEAEFIASYLSNRTLSKFESFLLSSFQKDNLDSASVFMKQESMDVFFYFNALVERYTKDTKAQNDVIGEIVSNGEDLVATYNNTSPDDSFSSYYAYITVCSYKKFMLSTMVKILNSPNMTWGEVFRKYLRFESLYNSIVEIQEKDNEKQSKYAQSIFDFWESDIRKKLAA